MHTVSSPRLYETDFYGWVQHQAGFLKAGNFASLDLDNLIEEIEDMGKNRLRALESRCEILLMLLLKWQFQARRKGRSWRLGIEEQRARIGKLLRENPSLKRRIPESFSEAYQFAIYSAVAETGLAKHVFPAQCPWTFEQVMDEHFWPDAAATA